MAKLKKTEPEPVDAKELEDAEEPENEETVESAKTAQKKKSPDAPKEMQVDEYPLIEVIQSDAAKLYFDVEKNAYRIKTLGKANSAVLKHVKVDGVRLKNNGFVKIESQEALFALLRRIRDKAELMAQLDD